MKLCSSFIAGTLLPCFAPLVAAAPAQTNKALFACVKDALIGENVENRIVTPSNDTYAAASVGDVLYVSHCNYKSSNSD